MRATGFIFILICLATGCGEREQVPGLAGILSPASSPKTFDEYADVAPLFAQENDTTYLINFWATWCKPCLEELPLLQQVQRAHEDEPLRIVLVSLDTEEGAIDRIPGYLEQKQIDLPTVVLTDEGNGWKRALDEKWDGSLPTSLLYKGGLRYIYRRPFRSLPDLESAVAPLLGQ